MKHRVRPSRHSAKLVSVLLILGSLTGLPEQGVEAAAKAKPPSAQTSGANTAPERIVLPEWRFNPGKFNAITDVPGIKVGHVTILKDTPHTIRTGVTAILPHSGNLAATGLWAAGAVLNGNGEMTGLAPLETSGILNSPILLTNTFSVGNVHHGVFQFYEKHYGDQWIGQLPVVAECYDGYFNTISDLNAIQPADAVTAIEAAADGAVPQGRVGAGTGMRSFELHAGIGTSSRTVSIRNKSYTVGVLVNTNHSRFDKLSPTIRQKLEERLGPLEKLKELDEKDKALKASANEPNTRQGSIVIVIATDLPLNPTELKQLALRAGIGVGLTGSTIDTTSGDFAIAFSTANPLPLPLSTASLNQEVIHPDAMSPAYRATVEAVVEAQLHAIVASHSR